MFDNSIFNAQIYSVYDNASLLLSEGYDVDTVKGIMLYFVREYKKATGNEHPHMSNITVGNIISHMATDDYGNSFEPDDYYPMIDRFFKCRFKNTTNLSMAFFMSGLIRYNRMKEIYPQGKPNERKEAYQQY